MKNKELKKEIECDFCGKKGNWITVLKSTEIAKKDGSDVILCGDCLNNYISGNYDKIKLKEKKHASKT